MDLIPAVRMGDIVRVRELLDSGEDPNTRDRSSKTALFWATINRDIHIIRLLLDRGADINSQNDYGDTALIIESKQAYDHTKYCTDPFCSGCGQGDIAEFLLDREADPNIRDRDGTTALIWASQRGNIEMVRLLLDRDVDPNIQNIKGDTALINAARYSNSILTLAAGTDYTKVVELLLRHGADPNIRNNRGKTASMIAERVDADDIARLIRDHIDLQRARQRLAFATRLLGNDDDLDYDVTTRMADYLHDLDQYGSGKRSSSSSSSSRKRKNKYYTRRRSFF